MYFVQVKLVVKQVIYFKSELDTSLHVQHICFAINSLISELKCCINGAFSRMLILSGTGSTLSCSLW